MQPGQVGKRLGDLVELVHEWIEIGLAVGDALHRPEDGIRVDLSLQDGGERSLDRGDRPGDLCDSGADVVHAIGERSHLVERVGVREGVQRLLQARRELGDVAVLRERAPDLVGQELEHRGRAADLFGLRPHRGIELGEVRLHRGDPLFPPLVGGGRRGLGQLDPLIEIRHRLRHHTDGVGDVGQLCLERSRTVR